MSLKAFHIVFIVVSCMLCAGFGAWTIVEYRRTGDSMMLGWTGFSLAALVALLVYGRWFLRKLRGEGYL